MGSRINVSFWTAVAFGEKGDWGVNKTQDRSELDLYLLPYKGKTEVNMEE
jgi:hypothetical protein